MKKENFVSFKFCYKLSKKIPFAELSEDISNIEFMKEDNLLTGYNISLKKSVELKKAEKECEDLAYIISDLISIKSRQYTFPRLDSYEAMDVMGNKRGMGTLVLRRNIEGAPAKLDVSQSFSNILNSGNPQIKSHLGYLAKAALFRHQDFPDHSIIEAFKIIEELKDFPSYDKFYSLRNILAHSPQYEDKTMKYFLNHFDDHSFDYRRYDPKKKIIILNLDSNNTLRKLNMLIDELIMEVQKYLKIA